MRIGFGYDNHRLIQGRKLVLGGIVIPSPVGEDAHSDGDVLIHAVIDAILGALSMGDIGEHFPPSDPKYKDISSVELLNEVKKASNAKIINIDCLIVLEQVKLKDYKNVIKENLASLLDIEQSRVSVKAKTHEGVDSTGKGEAIEAYAAILLEND